MAISDKLEYLNDTKQLLKDKINNLGGSIDDNTTFRQYANQLQTIYDNLPKTSYQEGTEVNLGVTSKGKLDYENGVVGIGQSEQDGTPTPSTPITINSVTGNQDVVVSGKNIFNSEIELGAYDNNGLNISANNRLRSKTYVSVEPNTQYTLSWETTKNAKVDIIEYTKNDYSTPQIQRVNNGYVVSPIVFTTTSTTKYIRLYIASTGDSTTSITDISNIQLEQGSTATSYESYITPTSYQLSLGDIELNAIGNYKDELVYDVENDRVYKNEKIGKSIITSAYLDGLANFMLQSINSYGIANFLLQITYGAEQFITELGLSNYFLKQNTLIANTQTDGILFQPRNTYIRINQNLAKTTDELRNYVDSLNTNGNPLLVYQVLATPVEIPITDTTLINQVKALYTAQSIKGTTIITSNGNLSMIIKVRALKGE